jgi:hypothetical protein
VARDIDKYVYIRSPYISITSWATCFAVSVPAEEFISAQPNNNINESMVSRLQAKYFHIYTQYIYFRTKATHQ